MAEVALALLWHQPRHLLAAAFVPRRQNRWPEYFLRVVDRWPLYVPERAWYDGDGVARLPMLAMPIARLGLQVDQPVQFFVDLLDG